MPKYPGKPKLKDQAPGPQKSDTAPVVDDSERHKKLMGRMTVARDFEKEERSQLKRVLAAVELKREVTDGTNTTTKRIKYPLVFAAYDNYQSALTSTPPQTIVVAEDPNDHVKALYWKGILDYTKRKVVKVEDAKYEFVQSFILAGKAVYKVGRQTEVQEGEEEVAAGDKTITRKVEAITKNQSFLEVVDPRRVWISPETRYKGPVLGEECPYVIEEMIKEPSYLEKTYGVEISETEKENISINDDVDTEKTVTSSSDNDDLKRTRLYAYYGTWDLEHKEDEEKDDEELTEGQRAMIPKKKKKKAEGKQYKSCFCEVLFTKEKIVNEREFPYDHAKKPYIYLLNYRKFFQPKAMGVLDSVLDLDEEYNENMNRIRTYIRRMVNPKWAKKTGTIIDEAALLAPDVGLIVDESEPNAFRPVAPPTIDASIFEKTQATEQLFQFLTNITYGETALKDQGTATGQNIAQQGADLKMSRMVHLQERAEEELEIMLLQLEQQFATSNKTHIKVVGPDVVDMVKQKKRLYQSQIASYQKQQDMVKSGMYVPSQDGTPTYTFTDQTTGMVQTIPMMDAPNDEYEMFKLSDDGRYVTTEYNKEDIVGEFELYIISQSSNRNNRAVRSQQMLKAIEMASGKPFINESELWRSWFNLNGETETDRLIVAAPPANNPSVPTANGVPNDPSVTQPNATAQTAATNAAAVRA